MEHSLSSLAFKGTIIEAITKAKQEKKLFLVYLAGDNPDSKQLETSTWTHPNVSETLTKYCVLLHILEGSSEALQFSAIYPQNSSPSITAIGYNGVRLWQTEGVVTAEVLASSLEKAWLSLHVQETTAALLTAALASEQNRTSLTSENVSSVQETPSANESSSSSRSDHIPSLNVGQLNSETIEEKNSHDEYKEADSKPNNEASLKAPHASVDTGGLNESTSRTVTQNTSLEPHQTDPSNSEKLAGENSELHYKQNNEAFLNAPHANVDTGGLNESASKIGTQNTSLDPHQTEKCASPVPRENVGQINGPPNNVNQEANKVVKPKTSETNKVQKTHTSDSPAIKSNDVFLNIRMPDGSSLQVKFTVMDTLRMVKDYISENSTSKIGSFDLAIPYPRKVFNEQELIRTLSSLGLFYRQALVVIPHKQTYSHYGGGSSTYSSNGGSNGDAGYWASLRRILSYANPFSYFSGGAISPNVAEGSQGGTWQNSSNPSLGNNLRGAGTPPTGPSSDQNRAPANASGSRQKSSGFGGNIHTLKRDEDDEQSNDRNMFWNGNSTEYGGDSDGK